MHDVLFQNQAHLKERDLYRYAAELGLDLARYTAEMDDHIYLQRVREHMDSGRRSHIRATPGFFLNGVVQDISFGMQKLHDAVAAAVRRGRRKSKGSAGLTGHAARRFTSGPVVSAAPAATEVSAAGAIVPGAGVVHAEVVATHVAVRRSDSSRRPRSAAPLPVAVHHRGSGGPALRPRRYPRRPRDRPRDRPRRSSRCRRRRGPHSRHRGPPHSRRDHNRRGAPPMGGAPAGY